MDSSTLEGKLHTGDVSDLVVAVVTEAVDNDYINDIYPSGFGKTNDERAYIKRLIELNKSLLGSQDYPDKVMTLIVGRPDGLYSHK